MRRSACGLLLACLTAAAQSLPHAKQLLDRVAAAYRDARSYDIQALVTNSFPGSRIIASGSGGSQRVVVGGNGAGREVVRLVYLAPDNLRLETSFLRMIRVFHNGEDVRFTATGQVLVPMAASAIGPPRAFDPERVRAAALAGAGFRDYTQLDRGAERMRVLRQEDVELDGVAHPCWVAEVSYPNSLRRTLWIDCERNVVLREIETRPGPVSHSTIERTFTVQKLRWNEPVEASLFEAPAAGTKLADGGIVPPVPIGLNGVSGMQRQAHSQCYEPAYTDEALTAGFAAAVQARFLIDEHGVPTDIQFSSPLGLGLDEMALACVSRWRYSPALKDGRPVSVHAVETVSFNKPPHSPWHLGDAEFHLENGVARPVFRKAPYPSFAGVLRTGVVPLRLTIGADGVPRDIRAAGNVDEKLVREAAGIVAKWRFTPGQRGAEAVAVEAEFKLVQGALVVGSIPPAYR